MCNPNSNDVIPRSASSELQNTLFQLRKVQTQHAKVEHHIIFLSSAIEEQVIPNGLAWDITVNAMDPNEKINQEIKEHIRESQFKLCEILRSHYDYLEAKLSNKKGELEDTIAKLETSNTDPIINKAMENIVQETTTLQDKLSKKRSRKIKNLKSPPTRRRPPPLNYQSQRQQQWVPLPSREYPPRQQQVPPLNQQTKTIIHPQPPIRNREISMQQQHVTYQEYPRDPQENNFGVIVSTFSKFLTNLHQQTDQLLSSLSRLNFPSPNNLS